MFKQNRINFPEGAVCMQFTREIFSKDYIFGGRELYAAEIIHGMIFQWRVFTEGGSRISGINLQTI